MIKLTAFIISIVYCCFAFAEVKIFVDPLYRATESAKNYKINPGDAIPFQLFRNEFEDAYEILYKKNGYLDIYVASENDINTGASPSILNKTLSNRVGSQDIKIPRSERGALLIFKNNTKNVIDAHIRIDRIGNRPNSVRGSIEKFIRVPFSGFDAIYSMPEINVYVKPCGVVNAYSTPDIYICTELIADLVEKDAIGALYPIILHELAHSLMFIWGIGDYKNEDMADEFATALMSIANPDSVNDLIDWFHKMDKKSEVILKATINSRHSLSLKRAENARVMLKNPSEAVKKWGMFLQPYVKKELLQTGDIR